MLYDHFREALATLDIALLRKMWGHIAPHLPQPEHDAQVLAIAHMARTRAESIPRRLRCYSHCWLKERDLPSGLPEHMREKAEQMFPIIREGVGIACAAHSEIGKAVAPLLMRAMSDAVASCYADGCRDPVIIKARIDEARGKEIKKLLGVARGGKYGGQL